MRGVVGVTFAGLFRILRLGVIMIMRVVLVLQLGFFRFFLVCYRHFLLDFRHGLRFFHDLLLVSYHFTVS